MYATQNQNIYPVPMMHIEPKQHDYQNRMVQQRYSNTIMYEARPLQDCNQYTSRTNNKSPDELTFQRTRSRIEELQTIINELQANRQRNEKPRPQQWTAYKTECPSRAISQNRQTNQSPTNGSCSPISFRGVQPRIPDDYSTNHPNNMETWLNGQVSEFTSPLQSHLATKIEKSRMFTPPVMEESDNKYSDLFTRYISNIKQTSPKFKGEDEQRKPYRPSASPLQTKKPPTYMPRPAPETADFTSQLNQFLALHRDHTQQEEEKSTPRVVGIIKPNATCAATPPPAKENLICVALQSGAASTNLVRKPVPATTPPPQRQSKGENSPQQGTIVSTVLPETMIAPNLDNFTLGKVLGLGSYAVVRLAVHKPSGQNMAIKTYEKSKLQDPQKRKNVTREMKILSKLRHNNIIKLHQAAETVQQLHLVMEYTSSNSLNSFIKAKQSRKLPEDEAKLIFRQVVDAIRYCHHKNVVHRDIKLENILVDDKRYIKLIDFGFSIAIDPATKLNVFCGTPSYMAPEIVNKVQYSFPADVWALGILLYKMVTGAFPFRGADDKELYRKINSGKIEFPASVTTNVKSLIQRLLRVNQQDRPTAKDKVLSDEWFQQRSNMEEECSRNI